MRMFLTSLLAALVMVAAASPAFAYGEPDKLVVWIKTPNGQQHMEFRSWVSVKYDLTGADYEELIRKNADHCVDVQGIPEDEGRTGLMVSVSVGVFASLYPSNQIRNGNWMLREEHQRCDRFMSWVHNRRPGD